MQIPGVSYSFLLASVFSASLFPGRHGCEVSGRGGARRGPDQQCESSWRSPRLSRSQERRMHFLPHATDEPTMHATGTVRLGCTDCHGGNADVRIAAGAAASSPEYDQMKQKAHPQPRDPELANRSANPERLYTAWLKESPEYVRFVNPGDLRVAPKPAAAPDATRPKSATFPPA